MIASDTDIRELLEGDLVIDPFDDDCVEPSSYDVHLSNEFLVYNTECGILRTDEDIEKAGQYVEQDSIVVHDDVFVLGKTEETVEIPPHIQGHVTGRSSIGRLSVEVHSTAGLLDPGFKGDIVFELSSKMPVELCAGDRIAQIYFQYLKTEAEKPYGHEGSHYQNQSLQRSAFRKP